MKRTNFLSILLTGIICMIGSMHVFADSDTMVFTDGMAQPILTYSDLRDADYSNEGSDILRFCVYVETDYDTDNDGKADLVKVLMQVPRSAAEGSYKAATIYNPTPYGAGTTKAEETLSKTEGYYENTTFDYDDLYQTGEKRQVLGEADTMQAAAEAEPHDWNYQVGDGYGYTFADLYDYYLVRGFAVAECSGIGTYGSEGFEVCGLDLERDASACVVEWLHGDRRAFTNTTDQIEIRADWSNGNVAMTGRSYGGTLAYEVATTGVEGLKTIIPYAGIACWYDYSNLQGVCRWKNRSYADNLASFNAGGTFLDDNWTVMNDDYARFLHQYSVDQAATNGDYGNIWAESDYSEDYEKISCSALIVHGLNDFNVMTKQSDLMYQAFKNAGQEVKLVFHQDGHNYLDGFMVNGELWEETINKWLCHYLYDVDNGIEDMAEVTAQSNVDGTYETYDSWRDFEYEKAEISCDSDTTTINTEGFSDYINSSAYDPHALEESYLGVPDENGCYYALKVADNTTIYGVPEIHLKLSTENVNKDGLAVTAYLIDTKSDVSPFKAFKTDQNLRDTVTVSTRDYVEAGGGLEDIAVKELVQSNTWGKVISFAETDLCNPGCGYKASDYTKKTRLEAGQYYDYTLYMQPTVYSVQPGHTLYLLIMGWNPYGISSDPTDEETKEAYYYSFTIDNQTIDVELPVR